MCTASKPKHDAVGMQQQWAQSYSCYACCSHIILLYRQESQAETDGSGRLQLAGRASQFHAFIMEGKEDWGYGGGSNPVMQLAACYARVLEDNWDTSLVTNTLLPAVGVEVFGHGLR